LAKIIEAACKLRFQVDFYFSLQKEEVPKFYIYSPCQKILDAHLGNLNDGPSMPTTMMMDGWGGLTNRLGWGGPHGR
jgi:hypothetical protein